MGAAPAPQPDLRLADEAATRAGRAAGTLGHAELASLIRSFNEVTGRLERTHEQLRAEVARLTGELEDAHQRIARGERLAELGQMAAGIAHEIRNPLGSIGLYARMLEEDLASLPESARTATRIADAVRRLNAIVGDVLSFSRELRPEVSRLGVDRLLDEAIDSGLGASEITVERRIEVPIVFADETLAHQALLNVLRNAAEAVAESRAEARILVGARTAGGLDARGRRRAGVSLWVRDAGPGIPGDVVRRMFNPFFTTRAAGTGLGLAIVHRIMDAHGGCVSVRNNTEGAGGMPAAGATVELRFPDLGSQEEAA